MASYTEKMEDTVFWWGELEEERQPMVNNNGFHDGNRFFKHKYASIDIESAINHIDSFADFEKYYTDELIDGNVLLKEYLTELLSRHSMKADP